jgi:hypothetical protein
MVLLDPRTVLKEQESELLSILDTLLSEMK